MRDKDIIEPAIPERILLNVEKSTHTNPPLLLKPACVLGCREGCSKDGVRVTRRRHRPSRLHLGSICHR